MNVISWIVVGLIAGWLAGVVMKGGGFGVLGDIIVGIVGGLLGGWIASSLLNIGAGVTGINLGSILVAFLGSVVLIALLRLLSGRRVVV
ncbi:MAG TPA: GlsB/YeaQ/YmgE family stress response membrane protein [Anaerolinea sp.]|nr:GlsB/YeaQ/YmgE family stress response membrane protein [Anaerolinea sp.]